jgi:hypothetical protein
MVAFLVVAWATGCNNTWRPSRDQLIVTTQPAGDTLRACLQATSVGHWVYERRPLPLHEDGPRVEYVRRGTPTRFSEGQLAHRQFLPLEEYLAPPDADRDADARTEEARRPRAPLEGGTAIFFRLEDPRPAIPPDLTAEQPITFSTPLSYYDYDGTFQARGTLTGTAELEGRERVEVPAGVYDACLRVRVDLSISFGWVAHLKLTRYMWLSPTEGEVKRIERFSGRFLVFWYGSAHQYEMIRHEPIHPGHDAALPGLWRDGALLLEGRFPDIWIGGMVVDLVNPERQTAPSKP